VPPPSSTWSSRFARQTHAAYVIAKKDAVIYYLKPPVISFGVIFPLFFYMAFAAGRQLSPGTMVPGIVAMALFFTASAVGPLVTPWERQARTWERLATSPASIWAIIVGDIAAGMAFGTLISLVPLGVGIGLLGAIVVDGARLALGIVLGALAFSALGVLLAAPVTNTPSQVMMISNLIRLPLIFVSGVFLPLGALTPWARWLAPFSPLSYSADLIRVAFGGVGYFPPLLDVAALLVFSGSFLALTRVIHAATRAKVR
jgi:ABC-2 type transport system permease protein